MTNGSKRHRRALLGASLALALAVPVPAIAQAQTFQFNIPAQPLDGALRALARASRQQILFDRSLVRGRTAPALVGSYSVDEGLRRLLVESGLSATRGTRGAYVVSLLSGEAEAGGAAADSGSAETHPMESGILVTGSRIRGAGPVGSETIVATRDEIVRTGRDSVSDYLRTLPQNTTLGSQDGNRFGNSQQSLLNRSGSQGVNLRGLGTDATLVLFNGHRIAPSGAGTIVDVSQIPLAALDRIEIVADSASALYGADAIGGVVNFIPRRNFTGVDGSVRYSDGRNFSRFVAGGSVGTHWPTGHIFLSYEYFRQSRLPAEFRDEHSDDLRPVGGSDFRSTNCVPGTLVVGGVTYALPNNQDGRSINPSSLIPGTSNKCNFYEGSDVIPRISRHSVVIIGSQEIAAGFSIFADVLASYRNFDLRFGGQPLPLTVPRSNAFFISPVSSAQSVTVNYNFIEDIGIESRTGYEQAYSATVGLEGDVARDINLRASFTTTEDFIHNINTNFRNSFYLNPALASSSPATAFNPFGDGGDNPPELVNQIRGFILRDEPYRMQIAEIAVNGPLFSLPGGDVRFSVGGEYRREILTETIISSQATATPVTTAVGPNRRTIRSGFAELLIPIVSASNRTNGIENLTISLAGRYEHYSDFGSTTNPKIGLSWEPLRGLVVRGTYGHAFKAPLFRDLFRPSISGSTSIPNPNVPGGTSTVLVVQGGNPDLRPETARIWSAGIEIRPQLVQGLSVQATLFNIDYRNRILALSAVERATIFTQPEIWQDLVNYSPTAAQISARLADPNFVGAPLPVSSYLAIVDGRPANAAVVRQRGLDLAVSYRRDTGFGSIGGFANATYLFKYDVGRTETSPLSDSLDFIGSPKRLRGRAGVEFEAGSLAGRAAVNHTGGYTNVLVTPEQQVEGWTTFDLGLQLDLQRLVGREGWSLNFDIRNVTDERAPRVANTRDRLWYDVEEADVLGRVISVSVRARL